MKAVSGKFHPIFQWFYFDSVESLPENLPLPPEEVDLQVGPFIICPDSSLPGLKVPQDVRSACYLSYMQSS